MYSSFISAQAGIHNIFKTGLFTFTVIPAQAGIQVASTILISSIKNELLPLDPRLRGDDAEMS
ncbi:MAG: hypothetical protein EOP50_13570 [Sphingobacteriales bacterium]|nr:MAG: hypothetical protein EOP50_13570 [Sphingobacteriales bacterium]